MDLRPEGAGLRLNSFLVSAAPGRVEGSGYVGDNSDLTVKAELGRSEALGGLLPQGMGWDGITLNAHVTGSTSAPGIEAQGVVRQPRIPQAPPTLVGDAKGGALLINGRAPVAPPEAPPGRALPTPVPLPPGIAPNPAEAPAPAG